MKALPIVLVLCVAAGAYWLVAKEAAESLPKAEADGSPVIHTVEETLHTHAGEDSPMVHAFEEALEKA
jgi:hypothetical protein